jgi:hypothetical protein
LSSQWSISFWLSHQYPICIPLLPHFQDGHMKLKVINFYTHLKKHLHLYPETYESLTYNGYTNTMKYVLFAAGFINISPGDKYIGLYSTT